MATQGLHRTGIFGECDYLESAKGLLEARGLSLDDRSRLIAGLKHKQQETMMWEMSSDDEEDFDLPDVKVGEVVIAGKLFNPNKTTVSHHATRRRDIGDFIAALRKIWREVDANPTKNETVLFFGCKI
jgi:hypothetical protein